MTCRDFLCDASFLMKTVKFLFQIRVRRYVRQV